MPSNEGGIQIAVAS